MRAGAFMDAQKNRRACPARAGRVGPRPGSLSRHRGATHVSFNSPPTRVRHNTYIYFYMLRVCAASHSIHRASTSPFAPIENERARVIWRVKTPAKTRVRRPPEARTLHTKTSAYQTSGGAV